MTPGSLIEFENATRYTWYSWMNRDSSVRKTYFFRGWRRVSQPGDTVVLAGIISSVCKISRHCLCKKVQVTCVT